MLGWPTNQLQRLAPFAPHPLQALHHYYGAICPCAPHRYSGARSAAASRRSLGIGATGSHVPYQSLCDDHAAYMPDAAQPVARLPLDLSRDGLLSRFRHRLIAFDTSMAIHFRSSSSPIPDGLRCKPAGFAPVVCTTAFSLTLTTTALNGRSSRRFEGRVWTLPPRGLPSSLVQHCIQQIRHWMHSWHTNPCKPRFAA